MKMRAPIVYSLNRTILLVVAAASLAGCFSRKVPVDLSPATILPVIAAASEPPSVSRAISLVRPTDKRTDQSLYKVSEASAFPIVVNYTFVAADDPAVWVGNGFAAGLENAGYSVARVESATSASIPTVLTVELRAITNGLPPGIHISATGRCNAKVVVGVELRKGGRQLLSSEYQGESEQAGSCMDVSTLQSAERKALENLLARAIPEISQKLRFTN